MAFINQVANKLKSLSGFNTSTGNKQNSDAARSYENLLNKSPVEVDLSSVAHMTENPFNFGTVTYPLNLDQNIQGHYMVFHILTSTPTSNSKYDSLGVTTSTTKEVEYHTNREDGTWDKYYVQEKRSESEIANDLSNQAEAQARESFGNAYFDAADSLQKEGLYKKKYVRTKDIIGLYMPATVTVDYKTKYNTEGINLFDKIANVVAGGEGFLNTTGEAIGTVIESGQNFIRKLGDKTQRLATGIADVDRQEVIFEGIDFRTFSFSYDFIPRSPEEALAVNKICDLFKYHSRPRIDDSNRNAYRFTLPSQFQIQFMYRSKENFFVNRIGTVVCTSCSITYGDGNTWKTFRPIKGLDGASPVKTTLKLDFTEIDLVDRNAIADGRF